MIAAGVRLAALSGRSGITAGEHLALLAAGANAGARMVFRSGLPSATAAVHLLHDRAIAFAGGGGNASARARQQRELAAHNLQIIMAVVGIVTSGALDQ